MKLTEWPGIANGVQVTPWSQCNRSHFMLAKSDIIPSSTRVVAWPLHYISHNGPPGPVVSRGLHTVMCLTVGGLNSRHWTTFLDLGILAKVVRHVPWVQMMQPAVVQSSLTFRPTITNHQVSNIISCYNDGFKWVKAITRDGRIMNCWFDFLPVFQFAYRSIQLSISLL